MPAITYSSDNQESDDNEVVTAGRRVRYTWTTQDVDIVRDYVARLTERKPLQIMSKDLARLLQGRTVEAVRRILRTKTKYRDSEIDGKGNLEKIKELFQAQIAV